ncbi:hypothetical protein ACFL4T_13780 [candidate division KSB1 bacterium]
MKYLKKIFLLLFCFAVSQSFAQGFYKDLFWDAGVGLDTTRIPVFQSLGLSMEYNKCETEPIQRKLIVGNEFDANGVLLYPDNSPRFKMIYTPGGDSRLHGSSLGENGRKRIRTFFENGSSFAGVCGGAAIISLSREKGKIWDDYYNIWPGFVNQLREGPLYPDLAVQKNCDLLLFRSFGEDNRIDDVMFTFGSYPVEEDKNWPEGTKILLRFESPDLPLHEKGACWSYKKNERSGTIVVINCHPEISNSGEHLALIESIFLHALQGVGPPRIKGTLKKGQVRFMNKETGDNEPAFTKIGDKQYHYFRVEIPPMAKNFSVTLNAEKGYDFNIYLKRGDFAASGDAIHEDTSPGSFKKVNIRNPEQGEWFIGVECASTVRSVAGKYFYEYIDDLKVLNGVKYSISATWE